MEWKNCFCLLFIFLFLQKKKEGFKLKKKKKNVFHFIHLSYGDFTVTKVKSRIFAVVWCFIGLIMTSLIVGAIVTALTTVNGSSQFKIYGSQVGTFTFSKIIF